MIKNVYLYRILLGDFCKIVKWLYFMGSGFLSKAFNLYYDGFRSLSKTSKTLWAIILIKLFIMFVILKIFFFPRFLNQFDTKEEKENYIMEQFEQRSLETNKLNK